MATLTHERERPTHQQEHNELSRDLTEGKEECCEYRERRRNDHECVKGDVYRGVYIVHSKDPSDDNDWDCNC